MNFQSYIITPIGTLKIVNDEKAIKQIIFSDEAIVVNENIITQKAKEQLQLYFDKKLKEFELPLAPNGTAFQKRTWQFLQEIPFGKTWSYTELALQFKDKNKVRAVGSANGKNPIAIVIPCHRVIGKSGKLVGYAGGLDRKKFLLELEGSLKKERDLFSVVAQ